MLWVGMYVFLISNSNSIERRRIPIVNLLGWSVMEALGGLMRIGEDWGLRMGLLRNGICGDSYRTVALLPVIIYHLLLLLRMRN